MNLPILKSLFKLPQFMIALAVGLVFFNINYALMARLPGTVNNMCVMGAGLNFSNLSFATLMSLLLGIFAAGFYALFKQNQSQKLALASLSGTAGFILGPFTVFCTLCTLPAVSLFGISATLNFFYDYNFLVKMISLMVVLVGLFVLNRQLAHTCKRCVY